MAEQVTVVVPVSKWLPELGVQLAAGEPATASLADAAPYVTFVPVASPVVTDTLEGGVTTGAVVSSTVTPNSADEEVLCEASVAVQLTA